VCGSVRKGTIEGLMMLVLKKLLLSAGINSRCDCFIAGFQKCFTTSVFDTLIQHPDLNGAYGKEVHFFEDTPFSGRKNLIDYHCAFPLTWKWSSKKMIEASPGYANEASVRSILSYNPKAKFLFLLRNPIDRFVSSWRMHHLSFGPDTHYNGIAVWDDRTLEQALNDELESYNIGNYDVIDRFGPRRPRYLLKGCYYSALSPIMNMIPKDQVQVYVCEEDILGRQEEMYAELAKYFGLKEWSFVFEHSNRSPSVEISDDVHKKLVSFYTDDVRELRNLLGRSLSSWNLPK